MIRRFRLCAFLFILPLCLQPARAGEAGSPPIRPSAQPLAVVRIARPGTLERLFATQQIRALGYTDWDYSGRLPGLHGSLHSLRGLMKNLADAQARTFWYCLAQSGGSLASQSGAFGCRWTDGATGNKAGDVAAWFARNGIETSGLALDLAAPKEGARRFAAARDAATLRDVLGNGKAAPAKDDGWRNSLDAFLRSDSDTVGVWFTPRPLLGMASLLTGVDFRGELARYKLGLPDSIALEFLDERPDTLGFEARFNGLLPQSWKYGKDATLDIAPVANGFTLTIPAPLALLQALDVDRNALYSANVDMSVLVPRVASLRVWFDADRWHWTLICLIGDDDRIREQGERLLAWLDLLTASAGSPLTMETSVSPWGDAIRRLDAGDFSLVFGVASPPDAGKGNTFFLAAGDEEDYPDVAALKVSEKEKPRLASWTARLDAATRGEIAGILADSARDLGIVGVDADAWEDLLPDGAGRIGCVGTSLSLRSESGAGVLIVPALSRVVADRIDAVRRDPATLAAARLRFLLGIASQSRYRGIGPDRLAPAPLPDSMAGLAFTTDPAGRNWLDKRKPRFPGQSRTASDVLRGLASGRALDGYRYRVDLGGGQWALVAESEKGDALRLDAQGNMSRRTAAGRPWEAYRDVFSLFF